MLAAMGRMRAPVSSASAWIRALPKTTLLDLLQVAHPSSLEILSRGIKPRNWLIVNLMLLAGLRRGEALLLACGVPLKGRRGPGVRRGGSLA